jgi:hypothetical protein
VRRLQGFLHNDGIHLVDTVKLEMQPLFRLVILVKCILINATVGPNVSLETVVMFK